MGFNYRGDVKGDTMKYMNKDTGEVFTVKELVELWEQFAHEMEFESFEEFIETLEEVEEA